MFLLHLKKITVFNRTFFRLSKDTLGFGCATLTFVKKKNFIQCNTQKLRNQYPVIQLLPVHLEPSRYTTAEFLLLKKNRFDSLQEYKLVYANI